MGSFNMLRIIAALLLLTASQGKTAPKPNCDVQRIFPITHVAFCSDESGRSSLVVGSDAIIHMASAAALGDTIPVHPPITIPQDFRIVFGRRPDSSLDPLTTFVQADGLQVFFGVDAATDKLFRAYFNAMQFLVKKFMTAECSIDGTTIPTFPDLGPIKGAMQALAVVFNVKDCTGGLV